VYQGRRVPSPYLCPHPWLFGDKAEATSLSPRSISDLEHLRRDNTMITTNTAAVSAKCYIPALEQGRWLE
jgi:hypothetical protein